MTEPVQKVGGASEVGQRKGLHEKPEQGSGGMDHHDSEKERDHVDISDEARNRAEGRHKKSILEHIAEKD